MGKYIIDTDQFTHRFNPSCIGVYGIGKGIDDMNEKVVWSRMVNIDDLDELNSKYIEENFEGLFDGEHHKAHDDVYQRGLEDGKTQGMSDLMTAIRKLIKCETSTEMSSLGFDWCSGINTWTGYLLYILNTFPPLEIIDKIKTHEQKQEEAKKRDIQNDLDCLMTQTGMTIDEIAMGLKRMVK